MSLRVPGRSVGRLLRSVVSFFFSPVQVWLVNREIRQATEARSKRPELTELRDVGFRLDDEARAEVAAAFADDIARIRRLEDKLAWHMTVVAVALTAATGIGSLAVAHGNLVGLLFVIGAFIWILAAGVLSLEGHRATPLYTPNVIRAVQQSDVEVAKYLTGERLKALSLNPARGWQLNNALFGTQCSLMVAAVVLAVGGLVVVAGQFNGGGEPPEQEESVEHVVDENGVG